jgi:hypothetical protein
VIFATDCTSRQNAVALPFPRILREGGPSHRLQLDLFPPLYFIQCDEQPLLCPPRPRTLHLSMRASPSQSETRGTASHPRKALLTPFAPRIYPQPIWNQEFADLGWIKILQPTSNQEFTKRGMQKKCIAHSDFSPKSEQPEDRVPRRKRLGDGCSLERLRYPELHQPFGTRDSAGLEGRAPRT